MPRVRAFILNESHVALIERRNSRRGRHYYVFPGGGVEPSESCAQALVREIMEELGLIIEPVALVAECQYGGELHLFYQVEVIGGTFGAGTGMEVTGQTPPEDGTYTPVWIPVTYLMHLPVFPQQACEIISTVSSRGWPREIVSFTDPGEVVP